MNNQDEKVILCFGPYRVDVVKRQLLLGGEPLPVTSKAFDTLVMLIRRVGEIVTKDELMLAVWPDTVVEENNLIQQISCLRKLFGERAGDNRFIVTVPGRGYCFVASVDDESVERTVRPVVRRVPMFDPGTIRGASFALAFILFVCVSVVWSFVRDNGLRVRPQSLAVMKFRANAVGDEHISTGISDTLRARLGSVEDLIVRPIVSDAAQDALIAGRDLHVDAVVTGSVQRERERVRVSIEMLDVEDGRIVWGRTFDDNFSNMFELQDSISREVVRVLQVKFSSRGYKKDKRHLPGSSEFGKTFMVEPAKRYVGA